jgi:zinc/manganese transport system substrate-binding protein/manganese/iron transport system substrate-binding protein
MRRLLFALPLLLVLGQACSSGSGGDDSGQLNVVATTTQIGDFARQVGGDNVKLTVILEPNQDAHDFEPSPSQLRAISNADLVLRNGLRLDAFVNKSLKQGDADVAIVTEGISLREAPEEHEDHEGHDEAAETDDREGDPHVWLAVANAAQMVQSVRDALVAADPANADAYKSNAAAYVRTLSSLDSELKAQVQTIPASCRKLVTNHDVLGYYADAYGFELVGSVIPGVSSEAKPSASDIADIVNKIKAEKVPAVFAEASINPALVKQVAKEAGVKVVDDLYGDSLGPKDSEGGTYVGMMRANTTKIVEALKDCAS